MDKELELIIEGDFSLFKLESSLRNRDSYIDDNIQGYREENLVKSILKDSKKNRTKIYQLKKENTEVVIGFIALSASRLDFKPALLIDYLFIFNKFRKKNSNINYAQYLIFFAFEKGLKLQKEIALSNLILYPDNEKNSLIAYYKSNYGFKEIKENIAIQKKTQIEKWLYLPLKK